MNLPPNLARLWDDPTDVLRIAGALLAAGALIVAFVQTPHGDVARHDALTESLAALQRNEARLGEAVLQLNFNPSGHYDEVTAIMADMQALSATLRDGDAAAAVRADAQFERQLTLLEHRVVQRQMALDGFKSRNAVLKNSLLYLPKAMSELRQVLAPASSLRQRLDQAFELLLFSRIHLGQHSPELLAALLDVMEVEAAQQPPALRAQLFALTRHMRLVDQYERDMSDLVAQLTSQPESRGLALAYQSFYNHQQQLAATYRAFLLLVTLVLLAFAVLAYMRLRAQAVDLKLAASVFGSATEGITITDIQGRIVDVNAPFTAITGYSRAEAVGQTHRLLQSGRHAPTFYAAMWQQVQANGHWEGEIWNRRKNGEVYPEWLSITAVRDDLGRPTHYVGTFADITLRKTAEDEIRHLAFYDPLTHLPNRRLLVDRMAQALVASARHQRAGALLFLDLDNFKTLNDTLGHDKGDLLLCQVTERLRATVREGDTVARLGGDEFVVLLEDLNADLREAAAEAEAIGTKILAALGQTFDVAGYEHHNSVSVGVTLFSDHHESVDELLKRADLAMYQAKAAGRNGLRFYDPEMQAAIAERTALESDLRDATAAHQLQLFYQPQVARDGTLLGAEALLRWQHPVRGMVSPGIFIPLAEDSKLILELGHWVLQTACDTLAAWAADPSLRDLTLAVNVSVRQFQQPDFVDQVLQAVRRSGIVASHLKLEMTESLLVTDVEGVIAKMLALRAHGIGFSLDDFGTGYSSLSSLKRLPLDQLKIDQGFAADLLTDPNDAAIARMVIALGHSMGITVIAEGVEAPEQRDFLAQQGCDAYQGYLFGRPMPRAAFEPFARTAAAAPPAVSPVADPPAPAPAAPART